MNKRIFALLILITTGLSLNAQQKLALESVIPPAPNAAELGKYGTYPVGMITGIPDISIPLYQVKSGSLTLPISISYHASGVQVNQKSTDLGVGWSLNAGGSISRTIYGSPDEGPYGYFNYTPPSFATLFGNANYYDMQQYAISPGSDLQPDLFAYSIGGKSGKFIYGKNQNFITIPFSPVIISKNAAATSFTITDDNGDIYTFNEYSSSNSIASSATIASRNRMSTWYLKSVVSADHADTISLTYETVWSNDDIVQMTHPIGVRMETVTGTASVVDRFVTGEDGGLPSTVTTTTTYNEKLIKRIDFSNGYIVCNRNTPRKDINGNSEGNELDEMLVYNSNDDLIKKISFNQDYFLAQGYSQAYYQWAYRRLKLTGVVESDEALVVKREHNFFYDETALPNFGSYAIDYWGYYNGATNDNLIPRTTVWASDISGVSFANGESYSNGLVSETSSWNIGGADREPSAGFMKAGMLTKIVYPTRGFSEFEFEPHKYTSEEYISQYIVRGGKTYGIGRHIKKEDSYETSYPTSPNYNMQNSATVVANIAITFTPIHPDPEYGESQRVIIVNSATGTIFKEWTHTGDVTQTLTINEKLALPKGNYTLKNEVYGLSTVYVNSSLTWTENTDQYKVKIGGGFRIKSIKNYDENNVLANQATYAYGPSENGLGVKLFNDKSFYKNYEDVVSGYYYGGISLSCWFHGDRFVRNFMGLSKYNSLNYMGSPVLYSTVTKYEGSPTANIGKTIYNYTINQDQINFPAEFESSATHGSVNSAWHQGELVNETIYKIDGSQYYPVEKKEYEYTSFNFITERAIMFKQHKQFIKLDACATDPTGPLPSNSRYGQGFYVMYEYPIKTGINVVTKETKTINPLASQPLTEVKTFQYQNPSNRYLTESTSTTSQGETLLRRLKYPQDMTDAVSSAMVSKNILSPVVEEKSLISINGIETPLSTMLTKYKQIGPLIKADTIKASKGADPLQARIVFSNYSCKGNLIEQHKVNDVKEAYIWGYDEEYPVAKIVGKSYNDCVLQSNLNLSIINNPATTDAAMRAELGKLYQLPGCLVTTFTYKPGVGVTSATGPDQKTTYYEYDGLGRLQVIKDSDGYIIKTIDYHYKQ